MEGTLLGAKLGLAFINICMNDLAETINSTLMQSPVRRGGSQGQILSSAAAAHRDHKAGGTSCDTGVSPAEESGGAAPCTHTKAAAGAARVHCSPEPWHSLWHGGGSCEML